MKKLVKEAERCKCCGSTLAIEKYDYFCDVCDKKVERNEFYGYMKVKCFLKEGRVSVFHFCSFGHYIWWLIQNKNKVLDGTYRFLDQPVIDFSNIKDFLAELKSYLVIKNDT